MLVTEHSDKLHMKFCETLAVKLMYKTEQGSGPFSCSVTPGEHQNATISQFMLT